MAVNVVREVVAEGDVPLYAQPTWRARYPWLVQGTTARGEAPGFDLGLWGQTPVGVALGRWQRLMTSTGLRRAVHARQVHGARVQKHESGGAGLTVLQGVDGHVTVSPDVLLSVSVADCVPVFLLAPERRAVAVLHAGWRGTAAGVLEAGVEALCSMARVRSQDLLMHLGPAICGECYEVGPEVHEALGRPVPSAPKPVDLRGVLVDRALATGIAGASITISAFCTRCGESPFFSHRGGDAARQMGVIGVRADAPDQ